jgi:hypothetical protein
VSVQQPAALAGLCPLLPVLRPRDGRGQSSTRSAGRAGTALPPETGWGGLGGRSTGSIRRGLPPTDCNCAASLSRSNRYYIRNSAGRGSPRRR